jgi:hypothetical protein
MEPAARHRAIATLTRHLTAWRRSRAGRDADALLRLLDAVADPQLRLHRFAEHLADRTAEAAATTIARFHDLSVAGDRRALQVCLGLLDRNRLARVLAAETLDAVAAAAQASGHPSAGLFVEDGRRSDAEEDEVVPRPTEPVGYRIAQARRPVAALVERLLFDPDPRVVQTVLGNPRLTEAEVLKLAASRRAVPEALEAIAQDDRWIVRYPVKIALAANPATPARVIVALLPHLMRQDLKDLALRASREDVRARAAAILAGANGATGETRA